MGSTEDCGGNDPGFEFGYSVHLWKTFRTGRDTVLYCTAKSLSRRVDYLA